MAGFVGSNAKKRKRRNYIIVFSAIILLLLFFYTPEFSINQDTPTNWTTIGLQFGVNLEDKIPEIFDIDLPDIFDIFR